MTSAEFLKHLTTFISDMDETEHQELVDTWMGDEKVKRFLHIDDTSDTEDTPVIPSKIEEISDTPPKKVSVPIEAPPQNSEKFDPRKFLKENPDTLIECQQENPKKSGSAAYDFYEGYKHATNLDEFLETGKNGHLKYEFEHGFLHILDDRVTNIEPKKKKKTPSEKKSPAKKKTPVKKVPAKKKTPVKKKVPIKEVVSEEEEEQTMDKKEEEEETLDNFAFISSTTSESDVEDDDDDWPSKVIDGVEYFWNESDSLLIDKTSAEHIGYLDDDGTIDYTEIGEDIHEKNKTK
jgi:outer membrane biosynthesis protein TonB